MNTHDKYELPPLPEWMNRYSIPADDGDSGDQWLDERMRACARAAIEADRQARGEPVAWPKKENITQDMRAGFERLYASRQSQDHSTLKRDGDGYFYFSVQADWVFYQRAWADALLVSPQPQQQASEPAPYKTYVQEVPSHCDRIVWRNRYYHLPIEDRPQQIPEGFCLDAGHRAHKAKTGEDCTCPKYVRHPERDRHEHREFLPKENPWPSVAQPALQPPQISKGHKPTKLNIGVSATTEGAAICIMKPNADGTVAVIYSGTHPLGDSLGCAMLKADPQNEWRAAIDHELVNTLNRTTGNFETPAEAIAALIDWNITVATDPAVNGGYKNAVETLKAIRDAEWRKWEELASPEEFIRWAKSRAAHALVTLEAAPEPKGEV